ncbi:hypothetical protein WJX73_010341 [Symbiochloris irregularis]|uniref:aspartate carbamoyltransferase n=1 Tax=Symbiochloris irregularis TaxID=706552 RepID=A0AAW1PRH0_9CHLO
MEKVRPGTDAARQLDGYVMSTLFYEPSTRTRLSFEAAMAKLGGSVVSTENAREFSSVAKGETLEDTIRTVEGYSDVVVLRHYLAGSAKAAASVAAIPVLNAGDGPGQHPTQALLDVYTILREVGKVNDVRIALVGDLANGRTARSLAYLLSMYSNVKMYFVAPDVVRMGEDIKEFLDSKGVDWEEASDLKAVAAEVDVLYQTRIQKERFQDRPEDYEKARGKFIVDSKLMDILPRKSVVMHPLPRVDEITPEVDADPRAAYFRQTRNGLKRLQVTAQQTALFFGQVWPEQSSSAAGVRTAALVTALLSWQWDVVFVSSSARNVHTELLEQQGCQTFQCPPNQEAQFTQLLQKLQPRVCVFDRFYTEEAFSFRVREVMPEALLVLDMQDLHCLRKARQAAGLEGGTLLEAMTRPPKASDAALQRELASIYRSDLTLVCSPVEMALLQSLYSIPEHKLCLAPFFASTAVRVQPFGSRANFMTIGNWRHPPNRDGVQWLCRDIWPAIRQQLPDAELHIYGAYMAGDAQKYHKPAAGVCIKGFAPSLDIMQQYRVCLAPLRFGAGLKGKIVDSWAHGLPVCTTPVGAEGMFPGAESQPEGFPVFVAQATPGHTAPLHNWGLQLLQQLYGKDARLQVVKEALLTALQHMEKRRSTDYVGQMLWSQQLRATEYFSRWIELKERTVGLPSR